MASARPAMSSPVKVVTLPVGEDEAGIRLDRWFRRRYPDLPQTHLNKIVRKAKSVDGKRVEISTRLVGQAVRAPLLMPRAKDSSPTPDPADAETLRDMFLFEDRDASSCSISRSGSRCRAAREPSGISTACSPLADKSSGERPVLVHRLDRDVQGVADRQVAENGGGSRRDFPFARQRRSIGRWSGGSPSRRRAAFRCFSPRARALGKPAAPRAIAPTSNACASRAMAIPKRSTRADPVRHGRQGFAAARLAFDAHARSQAAPISARTHCGAIGHPHRRRPQI